MAPKGTISCSKVASQMVAFTCQSVLCVWCLPVGVWPTRLPVLPLLSSAHEEAERPTAVTVAPVPSVDFSPSPAPWLLCSATSPALLHALPQGLPKVKA